MLVLLPAAGLIYRSVSLLLFAHSQMARILQIRTRSTATPARCHRSRYIDQLKEQSLPVGTRDQPDAVLLASLQPRQVCGLLAANSRAREDESPRVDTLLAHSVRSGW